LTSALCTLCSKHNIDLITMRGDMTQYLCKHELQVIWNLVVRAWALDKNGGRTLLKRKQNVLQYVWANKNCTWSFAYAIHGNVLQVESLVINIQYTIQFLPTIV